MKPYSRFGVFRGATLYLVVSSLKLYTSDDGSVVMHGTVENGAWSFTANVLRGTMAFPTPTGMDEESGLSFIPLELIPGLDPRADYNTVFNHVEESGFNPCSKRFIYSMWFRVQTSRVGLYWQRLCTASSVFWGILLGRLVEVKPKSSEDDDIPF